MAEFRLGRLKFNWRSNWVVSTAYVIDDIIKFGANTYVCKANHTSTTNENLFYANDLGANWSLHTEGISSKGEWVSGAYYKINDVVKYGNTHYRVKVGFSTSIFDTTSSNLEEYLQSFNYEDTWSSSTEYQTGDVVAYGGYTYVATSQHTNKIPSLNLAADWDILTTGFSVVGYYDVATDYSAGNVVQWGGNSYVAISTSTNVVPTDTSKWSLVTKGFNWKGAWNNSTTYQLGDVVKRLSNSYIGVATAGSTNQDPSTDAIGAYWDVVAEGAANNVMTTEGDLVYYTTGAARLPVGTNGQTLTVSSSGVPGWENNSVTHPVYYVTEEGNDNNTGENISRSFATLKHACGIATGPATIYVKAGTYEENLPIVVPTEVSIVGDNLRTSRIKPAAGNAHYQVLDLANAPQSTWTATFATYSTSTGEMVVTIGAHNLNVNDKINLATESITFSCNYNGATGSSAQKAYPRASGSPQTPTGADYAHNKALRITAITSTTITVNVNSASGVPISNSNVHTFVSAVANGITKAKPYVSYGSSIFNGAGDKCASILYADYEEKKVHIRPISGGLWTTSDTYENGASDVAINAIEQRTNAEATMFLMSNKTMLKDLLMEGMTGFVKAGAALTTTASISNTIVTGTGFFPDLVGTTVTGTGVDSGTTVINVTDSQTAEVNKTQTVASTSLTFTAAPSDINNAEIKGTFVSINPETPIVKSPYISNCSCQSKGGVGAIVDGNVHRQFADDGPTPSNKSIVMDSFTQIHDDGVGFWITNNGAAELVSSFTYYCHISYAATRGGRIRSLAGNSSWGNYAIVSSGFNQQEKSRNGQVEGMIVEFDKDTKVVGGDGSDPNDFAVGERIRGSVSTAQGYINSIQGGNKTELFYSLITAGGVGVGTGFVPGETITGLTNGTTATLINNTDANRGQSGFAMVCSGLGTSPTLTANGSIEFVTGSGNGGYNNTTITGADPFTFVIDGVSQTGADGRGSIIINRGQWSTTGAAHTGGTKDITHYPVQDGEATFLTPVASGDTTINVNTITGFAPGEYALGPAANGFELLKINSINSATQMVVTRAQDGAGVATSYAIGDKIVSIGATTNLINSVEVWKDFTGISTQMRVVSPTPFIKNDYYKIDDEFVNVTGITTDSTGITVLTLVEQKAAKAFDEQNMKIRYLYSQARLTGHDFLQVGTGGTVTTNWPDVPVVDPIQSQEITEGFPGRVFYVSTDQDGNFRVGKYFRVNQATGSATLNASAFDLSGLTSLRLGSIGAQLGASIDEFSTDVTLSQNSNTKVPTQAAVRTYVGVQTSGALADAVSRANAGIATAKFQSDVNTFFMAGNS
jgi:hypothetical protein